MGRYNNPLFSGRAIIDPERGHRAYVSLLDPDIPKDNEDVYVVTTVGDRLDLLAFQYYKDPTLWWYIAAANPELRRDSMFLDPGVQLRIPTPNNPDAILFAFNDFNVNR
jgi:nucleoid-associated protein YgaU